MAWVAGRRSLLLLTGFASFGGVVCYRENKDRVVNRQNNAANDSKEFDPLADSLWMASRAAGWNDRNIPRYSSAYLANKGIGFCSLGFSRTEIVPRQTWTFALLSEGFKSWEAGAFIFEALIPTAHALLSSVLSKHKSNYNKEDFKEFENQAFSEKIDTAIRKAFLDVDHGAVDQAQDMIISSPSKAFNLTQLSAAISGCTGMLVIYDELTHILKVANVGDARAVLGRKINHEDGTSGLEVHVLSVEHTSSNPSELARLEKSHSDTDITVLQSYAGRDITRAFGLAMCKWSLGVQERIHRDYLGEPPLLNLLTATTWDPEKEQLPYLNAEPDIQTILVQPDDFLIMASKDVWDSLSNEEAVGLVGIWLERQCYNLPAPISHPSPENFFGHDALPVKFPEGWEDKTTWYKTMKSQKRFICIDTNAAVHLIRNALGGANQSLTHGILRLPQPLSTNSRGELAVSVLHFD